jgi:hypothetical protein
MLNRETTMKVSVMHSPFGRGIQTSRKRLVSAVGFIFPENVIRELDAKPPLDLLFPLASLRNYLIRARLEEAAGKCLQKVLEFALQKGAEVLMKATKLLKAYGSPHS